MGASSQDRACRRVRLWYQWQVVPLRSSGRSSGGEEQKVEAGRSGRLSRERAEMSLCFACIKPIIGAALTPAEGGESFHPDCVEVKQWQAESRRHHRTIVGVCFTRNGVRHVGTHQFVRARDGKDAVPKALRNACCASSSPYRGRH